MTDVKYSRVPTEPPAARSRSHSPKEVSEDESAAAQARIQAAANARTRLDARFNQPTPSPLKRAALLLFVALLFWFAFKLRINNKAAQLRVVHTDRYSDEFRFRPAASPVITEKLKNGKLRVRGAPPVRS